MLDLYNVGNYNIFLMYLITNIVMKYFISNNTY